jgi:PAS domain S-box-containing protein
MDWSAAQHQMQAGQADVIDTIFKSESRLRIFDFTPPYADLDVPIFFHRSIMGIANATSLKGFTVGVKDGDACVEVLQALGIDTLKAYHSYSAVVTAAAAGEVRVFCMDKPPAVYLLNQRGVEQDFRQSQPLYSGQFHRAVHKGDAAMLKLLADGFDQITVAEYQAIEQRWKGAPIEHHVDSPYERYVGYVLLAVVLLTLLLASLNITLRRMMRSRTIALSESLEALKQAQQIKENTLAQLGATLDAIPDQLFEMDLQGTYHSVHASTNDLLVAPAADLLGKRVQEVMEPDAAAIVLSALQEAAENGRSVGKQISLNLASGTVWFELSVSRKHQVAAQTSLFTVLSRDITIRKQYQLRQDRLLLEQKAMLESDLIGIARLVDRDILWANPAIYKLFGFAPGESTGGTTRQFYISDEAYLNFGAQAYPILAKGNIYRSQVEMLRKDGVHLWVELSGVMLDSASGESLWMFMDISQRRQAELALQEQEARYRAVVDHGRALIWMAGLDKGCYFFNQPWLDFTGRTLEQEQGNGWAEGVHPDDLETCIQQYLIAFDQQVPFGLTYRLRRHDGQYRWILDEGNPRYGLAGVFEGYVGHCLDITERMQAEEALALSEHKYRGIFDDSIAAIYLFDANKHFIDSNQAGLNLLGYTREELLSLSISDVDADIVAVFPAHKELLDGGNIVNFEHQLKRKDGSVITVLNNAMSLKDQDGQTVGLLSTLIDITQRKRADEALQVTLRDKVALLHEVHHRVKNNLQVITSLLRLEAGRSDKTEVKSVLQDMQGRIRSMALLHETLYNAGNFASVDLGHYLKQIATQAFRSQSSGAVRLNLDLNQVSVSMEQATPCGLLVNELISNCLKHAFPQGRTGEVCIDLHVVAKSEEDAAQWRLCVRDNGIGLAPDFEHRRSKSLGLQLVTDLARQLGGVLSIDSVPASGTGAMFAVIFSVGGIG